MNPAFYDLLVFAHEKCFSLRFPPDQGLDQQMLLIQWWSMDFDDGGLHARK
jgi:hypothetical protein